MVRNNELLRKARPIVSVLKLW